MSGPLRGGGGVKGRAIKRRTFRGAKGARKKLPPSLFPENVSQPQGCSGVLNFDKPGTCR